MKRLIYGGSFNPPHLGHVRAARDAEEELQADCLLVIPARLSPGKVQREGDPSPDERLAMCRLSFAQIPHAEVSGMEMERNGKSYTADTVNELKKQYPEDELILLVGSDMVAKMPEWVRAEEILRCVSLAVLMRRSDDPESTALSVRRIEEQFGTEVTILSCSTLPVTSTMVKEKLGTPEAEQLVEKETLRYIEEHGLYRK